MHYKASQLEKELSKLTQSTYNDKELSVKMRMRERATGIYNHKTDKI